MASEKKIKQKERWLVTNGTRTCTQLRTHACTHAHTHAPMLAPTHPRTHACAKAQGPSQNKKHKEYKIRKLKRTRETQRIPDTAEPEPLRS